MKFEQIYMSDKLNVLFLTSIFFGLSYFIGISKMMILLLDFLIFLEIIRTIYDYIVTNEHRIKMRYIIDGGIVFGLRELFVAWIMLKTHIELALIIISVSITLIGILIWYRSLLINSSPDVIEH